MTIKIKVNHQLEKLVKNPTLKKEKPFDYSVGNGGLVDLALKGDKSSAKILFRGDKPFDFDSISKRGIKSLDKLKYQVVFAPIGFGDDVDEDLFIDIIEKMDVTFKDFEIQFSYLSNSIPLEISHIERYPLVTDPRKEQFLDMIKEEFFVDCVSPVLNTDGFYGSGGIWPIFSGRHKYAYPVAAHELGHHFSLSDGYERYYPSINGSELFMAKSQLPSYIFNAVNKTKPPIYRTGNHFKGKAVYRFYENSIMTNLTGFYEKITNGENVFNDLQKDIIKRVIRLRS